MILNDYLKTFVISLLFIGYFCIPPSALAQDDKSKKESADKAEKPKSKDGIKAYEDLIGEEVSSDEGLFTIHFKGEKLYFEIPYKLLGIDMLLISRISQRPEDLSPYINAGSKTNEQVVRWERKGKKILLKGVSYNSVADEELPISLSVKSNNFEPIIEAFNIEAYNSDSTGVLIEMSKLYLSDNKAISGLSSGLRKQYEVRSWDKDRSFVDTARSYPINVEVTHTMTYNANNPPANSSVGAVTLQMNQSMILLPEDPMMPRLYDKRVGWFTVSQVDYSSEKLKSDEKTYIRRWRLEPKDPAAYARGELVEPIKPIVYYLDPATPEKFRTYFRQGIEDWNTAFEAAGFKNAIIAKDPPTKEEDPEFSPEDARYSVVRYVATTTRNAVGPSVSDPRTGEIIESDIIWYHNHLRSYRNRYLLETGAANPKARTLDTPEEEIGEMMRRVISHEVGHALGLPHNMKASAAYPVDSLRSGSFTQKYGIATTIMDYARYNYIAQPGDENIRFVRQLGPYDLYSIEWGYRVIPNANTPEAEKATLNSWIEKHEGDPVYMFGSGSGGIDPTSQTEGIGDNNVKASMYGLDNLKKVAPNLIAWTTKDGESYQELAELYGELGGVWSRYIGHVVTNIGGVYETHKMAGQDGAIYEPVSRFTQKEAMRFLNDHAFSTPTWMLREDILRRIEPAGAIDRVRSLQARHLNNLLDMGRLARLVESEAFGGASAYSLIEMMDDLRTGIWAELYQRSATDPYRRSLQRAWVEGMQRLLTEEQRPIPARFRRFSNRTNVDVSTSDIRPIVKAQLNTLKRDINSNIKRVSDDMTRYHLEDIRDRIDEVLEGED